MGAYAHYGSASGQVDYETTIGSFYVNGEFLFADGWSLSLDGAYSVSEAAFASIESVELPEETVDTANYDFSEIHTYSDLDFAQLEVSTRLNRELSKQSSVYVGVGFFDLQDDAAYVYGDQSGSVLYTRSGVQVRF